jgi:hypothetical protein
MPSVTAPATDIYGGQDPRNAPIYSVSEVAHHLRLLRSTVRNRASVRRQGHQHGRSEIS